MTVGQFYARWNAGYEFLSTFSHGKKVEPVITILTLRGCTTKARDNGVELCLADCLEKLKKRKITHEDFTNLYCQKLVEYRFNIHTIARKFTKIKKTNPEIRHPSENDEKIRRAKHANEDARHDNPAVLDVTLLLEKIIVGLKCALEKKLYPQIQFCLSFLVCTRPDDFNCKKIRTNGGTLEHWNNVRVFP